MKTLNFKTLLIVALATCFTTSSFAQEKGNRYVLNGFWNNWFVSAGAGAQYYAGGNPFKNSNLTNKTTVIYNVTVGKWVTPVLGLRVDGTYTPAATRGVGLTQMEVYGAHGEVMIHLSNAISGYKYERLYNAVIYGGAGYSGAGTESWRNAFSMKAGLLNQFRIIDRLGVNIDLSAMAVATSFDGLPNSNAPFDLQLAAIGSLTYNICNKKFDVQSKPVEVDLTPYNKRINELESQLNNANAKANELNKRIAELQNQKPVTKVEKSVVDLAGATTFFMIGSSKLGPRDIVNLEELAAFIKQTPGVKYQLSGLIDFATGSRDFNIKLCQARVQSVYDQLVQLGISEDQLVKSMEDPTSPSSNPILNRGVVVSSVK